MDDVPFWATRLRAERRAQGWTQREMAKRLEVVATGHTRAHLPTRESLTRMIKDWEAGRHRPRDPYPMLYCRAFNVKEGELFGGEEAQSDSSPPPIPVLDTVREVTFESHGLPAASYDEDDDMERRAAMQVLTALSAGSVIPAGSLETVLAGVERALGIREDLTLDDWERTVATYGQLYYAKPPSALIGDLTADLIDVSRLLARQRSPGARTSLLRISSQMSALMATDFSDTANQRAARLTWRTARRAADASGDRDLSVWVRAREADCAFWQNQPKDVILDLLDDAAGRADGAPSVGLAVALEVRAKLLAMHGDTAGVTSALNRLSETFERLPEHVRADRAIGSSIGTSYPEALLHRTTACAYAFLGDKSRATGAVDRAIAGYPVGLIGGNLRLLRALALVHDGHVDDAVEQATTIAGAVACLTPSRRLLVCQVLKALPGGQANTLPAVRELRALVA